MRSSYQQRSSGRSPFLLPATLMLSAILIALWTLRPQATVKTSASEESSITIQAAKGNFDGEFDLEIQALDTVTPSVTLGDGSNLISTDNTYHVTITEDSETIVISPGSNIVGLTFQDADEVTSIDGSCSGLKEVDVSNCPNLETLNLKDTEMETLYLTDAAALTQLNLNNAGIPYSGIHNYKQCTALSDETAVASTITLGKPTVVEVDGKPAIAALSSEVGYTLVGETVTEGITFKYTAEKSGTYDTFDYEKLFGSDKETESVTLHCTAESSEITFVRYKFDVTIQNPNCEQSTTVDDSDVTATPATPDNIAQIANDGTVTEIIDDNITGSTTQSEQENTEDSATVESSETTTTTTTTKATTTTTTVASAAPNLSAESTDSTVSNSDDTTTTTTTTTTAAPTSTTTTTKTAATNSANSIPVSNSDAIVSASVSSNAVFVDTSGNAISSSVVRITSTSLNGTTTLSKLRTALASKGVTASNSLGFDISLTAKGYSGVNLKANSGSVTVTLDYPSAAVKASRSAYDFIVYHQTESTDTTIRVETLNASATSDGIQFTTTSFSPFLLVWTESGSSTTDDGKGKGPDTGEDDLLLNLSLMLAVLSVISLATILLKKKYTTAQETAGYQDYTSSRRYSGSSRYSDNQYYPRHPRSRR